MAKSDRYIGELILKMINRETGEISKVDYRPQKPAFPLVTDGEQRLPRRSPEECGIRSSFVLEMLKKLNSTSGCDMHKFMMIKNGYVIGESSFEPFDMDMWHVTYSMCKSITGMAIGMLVDDGKISVTDRVKDIMGSKMSIKSSMRMKDLTVEHLLTMSSGISFNEAGAITGNDWRKGFLESGYHFEPGTQFEYNSMNSYMLSAIVTEITGETMFDFLKPRLFEPLGIKRVFWEKCPQGITKGGWGLFLRIEDMAKLGQLYLQKGMWNGQRILSEKWVEESSRSHIETGIEGSEGYGYHMWNSNCREGSYTFNGMLGQDVFIFPDVDMIIVTNAGNDDIFQKGAMSSIIHSMMQNVHEYQHGILQNEKELNELKAYCKYLQGRTPDFKAITDGGWNSRRNMVTRGSRRRAAVSYKLPRNCFTNNFGTNSKRFEDKYIKLLKKHISGCVYDIDIKGRGILPLMMQVIHNNFTDGISRIGFHSGDKDEMYIDFYEGDEVISIRCGFGGMKTVTNINMHDEIYKVAMSTVCATDEYNRLVLKNVIYFLEEAATRIINIYFDDPINNNFCLGAEAPKVIEVRMDETPGKNMIIQSVSGYTSDGSIVGNSGGIKGFLMGQINKFVSNETLIQNLKDTISPVLHGQLIEPDDNINHENNDMLSDSASDSIPDSTLDNMSDNAITEPVVENSIFYNLKDEDNTASEDKPKADDVDLSAWFKPV